MATPARTMKTQPMPEIQTYLDVRQYLQDIYQWRKQQNASFSYSLWADELGFKSRSFLRLVVMGKRSITDASLAALIRGLQLKKADVAYFERLVRFNQASTVAAREQFGEGLFQARKRSVERSEIKDYYSLVSSVFGPRLQVLLTLENAPRTADGLAKALGAPIREIEDLLTTLERLGLAKKSHGSENEWEPCVSQIAIQDHLGSAALQSFHQKSLEEAVRAIDLPVATRRYQSAIVPLTEREYEKLCEKVRDFVAEISDELGVDRREACRLYQLNLNLIPVSLPILRPDRFRDAPIGDFTSDRSTASAVSGDRVL